MEPNSSAVYYTVYSPAHKYIIHRLIWHLPDGVFFTSSNKVPKDIFVCIFVYICVYSRCQPKEGRELPLTALYEPSSQRAFDFPSMAGTLNNSEIETAGRWTDVGGHFSNVLRPRWLCQMWSNPKTTHHHPTRPSHTTLPPPSNMMLHLYNGQKWLKRTRKKSSDRNVTFYIALYNEWRQTAKLPHTIYHCIFCARNWFRNQGGELTDCLIYGWFDISFD